MIFSAPSVRGLLSGAKTQTRRLVNLRSLGVDFIGAGGKDGDDWNDPTAWGYEAEDGEWWTLAADNPLSCAIPPPHGLPGDHLWIREVWAAPHDYDHLKPREIPRGTRIHYRATEEPSGLLWRSPLFLLEWAARAERWEITEVRVQRLQEIGEEDCVAEGFGSDEALSPDGWRSTPRGWFGGVWEKLNGKRASWSSDPWVWAISFRRVA